MYALVDAAPVLRVTPRIKLFIFLENSDLSENRSLEFEPFQVSLECGVRQGISACCSKKKVLASDVFGTQIHFSASLSLLHKQMRASRTLVSGGSQCGATRSVIAPGCFPAAHQERFVQTAGSSLCQATTAGRMAHSARGGSRSLLRRCTSAALAAVCCGSRVHETVTRVWLSLVYVLRLQR